MTNDKFDALFGGKPARAEAQLAHRRPHGHRRVDSGASPRKWCCSWRARCAGRPASSNLCLAGGVALNCVANGRVLREGKFEHIWIQPAAGDAGGAFGAALRWLPLAWQAAAQSRCATRCAVSYSGPQFEQADIEARLTAPVHALT